MESFNLNIIPGKDRPVCHASQYDIGRTIHVNLFEGFNVFTLDGTEVISISVRKPDGNVVTESVTNTSDSYVEFVTTEQMTACSGSNLCELKLEKGADVIGTMNFILEVEQDPLDGGVQSDTQIHNLQTQVADLVAIEVADQYDSADVIFDNTPTAGHGVGYAVTSEGVKNAIDAAVGTVEDIIGDAYDENNTYNTGDYCINSDVLYKCNDDNVTGPWDATKWDATTVADELALKQNATDANLQTTDQTVVGAINELKSDSEYHAGDAINISNLQLAGLITSGQKSIYIQLPLPKAIGSDVNTITLNANALFYIRHVSGGYILNNQSLTSIGSVTLKKNISGIFIGVDMTTAFSGCPNNTPLVVSTGEGANDFITFS